MIVGAKSKVSAGITGRHLAKIAAHFAQLTFSVLNCRDLGAVAVALGGNLSRRALATFLNPLETPPSRNPSDARDR